MIVFTSLQFIPNELLEQKGIRQVVKYNLSSYYNDAPTLSNLVPTPSNVPIDVVQGDRSDPSFDIAYHNYIINNPQAFAEFMNIIIPAFVSPETLVHIMIKNSDYRDVITESLAKLIQQRYGYNICIVNEIEDFIYTEESDFSIPGLYAYDNDFIRWRSMIPYQEGDYHE